MLYNWLSIIIYICTFLQIKTYCAPNPLKTLHFNEKLRMQCTKNYHTLKKINCNVIQAREIQFLFMPRDSKMNSLHTWYPFNFSTNTTQKFWIICTELKIHWTSRDKPPRYPKNWNQKQVQQIHTITMLIAPSLLSAPSVRPHGSLCKIMNLKVKKIFFPPILTFFCYTEFKSLIPNSP